MAEPTAQRSITIEVPEDRVAHFYAFFGRFLAGPRGSRRHGRPCRGGPRHGRGCAERDVERSGEDATSAEG